MKRKRVPLKRFVRDKYGWLLDRWLLVGIVKDGGGAGTRSNVTTVHTAHHCKLVRANARFDHNAPLTPFAGLTIAVYELSSCQ